MRGGFAIISCLSGYSDKTAPHPASGHLLPQEKAYKKKRWAVSRPTLFIMLLD